jgi:hypothetical protein
MRAVLSFTVAYTALFFAYGLAVGSPLTNLYTGITVGLVILFAFLHKWARWSVSTLWVASMVGLGNMLGGVLLVDGRPLYMAPVLGPIVYDKVFHAVAAFGMVFVAWEAVRNWVGTGYHRGGLLLTVWLMVMGGGAVVEIAEYIGTLLGDVNVGDYANNALDLVANATGALLGVFVVARRSD